MEYSNLTQDSEREIFQASSNRHPVHIGTYIALSVYNLEWL